MKKTIRSIQLQFNKIYCRIGQPFSVDVHVNYDRDDGESSEVKSVKCSADLAGVLASVSAEVVEALEAGGHEVEFCPEPFALDPAEDLVEPADDSEE